jgi:hypothetical protein
VLCWRCTPLPGADLSSLGPRPLVAPVADFAGDGWPLPLPRMVSQIISMDNPHRALAPVIAALLVAACSGANNPASPSASPVPTPSASTVAAISPSSSSRPAAAASPADLAGHLDRISAVDAPKGWLKIVNDLKDVSERVRSAFVMAAMTVQQLETGSRDSAANTWETGVVAVCDAVPKDVQSIKEAIDAMP